MSIDKKKKTNKELRQQAEADALEDMEKPTRVKGPGFLNRLFAQQPVTDYHEGEGFSDPNP